jgi:hypothetical protein
MAAEVTPDLRSPVIFTWTGTQPDVRLKVFDDIEFHVHLVVLKARSAFFRKFLDSPDKQNHTNTSSPSKYEWATKIDDDGADCHLIAAPDGLVSPTSATPIASAGAPNTG